MQTICIKNKKSTSKFHANDLKNKHAIVCIKCNIVTKRHFFVNWLKKVKKRGLNQVEFYLLRNEKFIRINTIGIVSLD